ncbi:MAG TPA: chemotaxis protein CheW [Anaeromyxobacteraceae bacterium]|nr:chemotaxis protein CheW [Anaeromyxobacteraceae bacterium]
MPMESLAAERKALLFSAGGIRLALRLSHVREIISVAEDAPEVNFRGAPVPGLLVAMALGLPARPARFALVTEEIPGLALRVDNVHGIADLALAEVFKLPGRTFLPQPSPFQGAILFEGAIALELGVSTLGWAPIEPAGELSGPPPEMDFGLGREFLFARGKKVFAVPIQLLAQVVDRPVVFPVPLTPSAHRGLIYHGRAIHPVFDLSVLYGEPPAEGGANALLIEAGGTAIAALADRVLPAGGGEAQDVCRPSWDLLFPGA